MHPCLLALATAINLAACAQRDPGSTRDPASPGASSATATASVTAADPDAYRTVENGIATLSSANGVQADEHLLGAAPGEYLIKFKGHAGATSIQRTLSKVELRSVRAYKSVTGLRLVKLAAGVDEQRALATYRSSSDVEYVEPNYIYRALAVPNDPRFSEQWGMHNTGQTGGIDDADIDAPEAWNITTGSDDVVIAVIDSGVDYNHPDLAANMFRNEAECTPDGFDSDGNSFVDDCHGIDPVNADADPMDDEGHGTMVAGVVGAVGNNGIGVAGVAWQVKILPCKFLDSSGSGFTSDALTCLDYIAELKTRGVNIVASNASWGSALWSRALEDAVRAQMAQGILLITAAGNAGYDNDRFPHYPCAYYVPNVICGAALTNGGYPALFSQRGRATVHLGAPGENILTTSPGGGYELFSGTSAASPFVAGTAALLASQSPSRDWRAIKNLILAGSVYRDGPILIAGQQVNAFQSLTCSNQVIARRLRPVYLPFEENQIVSAIDVPIELSAQHINCAAPNGPVTVSIQPGGATVTLLDNGTGKDAAAGDGIYTAEWVPTFAGEFELTFPGNDIVRITVDSLLKRGFPVKTLHTGGTYQTGTGINVLVGNIDADPELEALASALANGPLYAWDSDGSLIPGWPTLDGWSGAAYSVLGEFDPSSAGSEIYTNYMFESRAIYHGDGVPLAGWPLPSGNGGIPMAADLDADGIDEVLFAGTWRADGSPFRPDTGPDAAGHNTAVGDLDGDGDLELVYVESPGTISGGTVVRAVHHDGQSIFIVGLSQMMTISHPTIGDVDGDGEPEIAFLTVDGPPWNVTVRIYSASGSEERSIVLPNPMSTPPTAAHALADLDGDGIPEIVVHSSSLFVLKGDLTPLAGWPADVGNFGSGSASPVIGDLTGDGQPEVVVICNVFDICIFKRDGSPVAGFPKTVRLIDSGGVPAIADLDLDGRNDLIVVGQFWGGFSGLYDKVWAYDLHGPAAFGPIEWGQFKGSAQHLGAYELGKNLATQAYLTAHVRGTGSIAAQGGGISCGSDCIELYPKGSTVTLTATPAGGAAFTGWRGACAGQSNPCSVSVQRYTSVVAEFADSSTLTVAMVGAGGGVVTADTGSLTCPGDCTETYPHGTSVRLTAAAAAGSVFTHWSGACSGTDASCTVAVIGPRTVAAHFAALHRLTVTSPSDGSVTSSPGGIDCGADCSENYAENTNVTLTARPASDAVFAGWSGDCSGSSNTCVVFMSAAKSVTATFTRNLPLQVAVVGNGEGLVTSAPAGISCLPNCVHAFAAGSVVTLLAVPSTGSMFGGWFGGCSGANETCTVTMNQAKAVTATFIRLFSVQVALAGSGAGTVTSSPAGIACPTDCQETLPEGTVVTLTAVSLAGSSFSHWSGACEDTATTCVVTLDRVKATTATFSVTPPPPPPLPLNLSLTGTGVGKVTSSPAGIDCGSDCAESYTSGTHVTLTAAASAGSVFSGWSGACAGSASQCVVTLNAAASVSASFMQLIPLTVGITGSGTVTSNPSGVTCPADCNEALMPSIQITLTAAPAAGNSFDSWTGACAGQSASCTFTMDSAKSATAVFRANAAPPPPSGGGGGGGNAGALLLAALALFVLSRTRQRFS